MTVNDPLTTSQRWKLERERDRVFADEAREALDAVQLRRTAWSAAVARLVMIAIWRLPMEWANRIHGPDAWESRVSRLLGATLCRWLGHRWSLCVAGRPTRIGHLLVCDTCGDMPHTDDLDRFDLRSRARRDLAVVAAELDWTWDGVRYLVPTSWVTGQMAEAEQSA